MKTIVLYNHPFGWFTPLADYGFDMPIVSSNNMVSETTNESPTGYTRKYLMPEFRKKDLSIKLENGILKVEAQRKSFGYKWFNRSSKSYKDQYVKEIRLSDDMDTERISARFKKGHLTIDIPKKKEFVNYREIPISGMSDNLESIANKEAPKLNLFASLKLKIVRLFKKDA